MMTLTNDTTKEANATAALKPNSSLYKTNADETVAISCFVFPSKVSWVRGRKPLFLQRVVPIPAVPIRPIRRGLPRRSLGSARPGGVGGGPQLGPLVYTAQPLEDGRVELVGEFAAHLDDLAAAAVVAQGASHLLVGHGLAVALALAPALGQPLLVLGDEVEGAVGRVGPLDGVGHGRVAQRLVQVLVQTQLLATCGRHDVQGVRVWMTASET